MNIFKKIWSNFNRYLVIRKTKLKTVNVESATQKDLEKLGRKTETFKIERGNVYKQQSLMQVIRHKKTGRIVMFPGTIEQIKERFGNSYEIVESANKDTTNMQIDL